MKTTLYLIIISLSFFSLYSCNSDNSMDNYENKEELPFSPADNSIELKGSQVENVYKILNTITPKEVIPLGKTSISEKELAEIKDFTQKNIVDKSISEKDKMLAIFKWVHQNIKYDNSDNSAYATFINRKAICQGYANLFRVMCYTQGIPVVNANGLLSIGNTKGGHAWNYAFVDGQWSVVDPTNNLMFLASNINEYDKKLMPQSLDYTLWEDNLFEYAYYNSALSITNIKESAQQITVPYSTHNFMISNFNPISIPATVKEIYLGANIKKLGDEGSCNLKESGKNLLNIYVDAQNKSIENYKGIIYKKGEAGIPIYIPGQLTKMELKPQHEIQKNTIYNHQHLETLTFGEGTNKIADYAVENCPNLKVVNLPASVKSIGEKAFYGCHKDLKINRAK